MTASHISGPVITYGQGNSTSQGSNPEAGPDITYQGDGLLDVRYPYSPGVTGVGKIRCFQNSPYFLHVDAVPATFNAATFVAAATGTAGTAMTLKSTAAAGLSPNVPFLSAATNAVVTAPIAMDFGWAGITATTTTASAVVTLTMNTTNFPTDKIFPGQWVYIVGAGFIQVASVQNGVGFTATAAVGANVTNGQIGGANFPGTSGSAATYVEPYINAGAGRVFDPTQALSRGLSVTSSSGSDTTWAIQVVGWDLYGVPMTEVIAVAAGTVAYGVKTWKYINTVTPYTAPGSAASPGSVTVTGGKVTAVALGTAGSGYQQAPFVVITAGSTGTGAIVQANISGGAVASYTVIDGGYGYATATAAVYGGINVTTATVGTLAVGNSDVFGCNLKNDKWEYNNFFWAGVFLSVSTGWTQSYQGLTSNSQTADVRGTLQASAQGGISGASSSNSNGVRRLALFSTLPLSTLVQATPANTVPMFGAPQA